MATIDIKLNIALLKRITCPACLDPMDKIIYLCALGHSVCQNCKKYITICPICRSKMTTGRNYALEAISDELFYPCKFDNCKQYITKFEYDRHSKLCLHKHYSCLLTSEGHPCKWMGPSYKLPEHAHQMHECKSWMEEENLDRWREGINDEVQLIRAHERAFYLHRVCETIRDNFVVVHWIIQLIGPKDKNIVYGFLLHIYCENSTREIKFSETIDPDAGCITDMISKGKCVSVPVKNLRTYNNKYNSVWYKLKITKNFKA